MRLSRAALALLSPACLLIGMAGVAYPQVTIVGHTIQFSSASPQFSSNRGPVSPLRMSFKSSTFDVEAGTDLNDYRSPDDKHPAYGKLLRRQQGIGRLLLFTTCNGGCQNELWINNSEDPSKDDWKNAATADRLGLNLLPAMFENNFEFAVNGARLRPTGGDMHIGNSSISHYYIQVFHNNDPCRLYKAVYGPDALRDDNDSDSVSIDLLWTPRWRQTANGIVVGAPKVYDSYALMAMRNDTLHRLQTINPFVASSITGAYGNLQGVTRDQSFLNVQGQFAPPVPSIANGTDQTATCPAGYYPAGSLACAPIPSGTNGSDLLTAVTTSQTVTPASGVTPGIPPLPTYTPPTTPGTLGQSSTDTLVEQVQLNAQLQMYQLLLEGAQSDTLLVQNSRAVASRAQTTIGFPISIDPPRQFRHAVAEVRVLIEPYPTPTSGLTQPVSIVTLLPSQKTYNVAKITTKQHAFGGAAVIDQVASVGVSTGKTKDRLFLAKDTDTIALQYDHPEVKALRSPLPEQALTGLEALVRMQRFDDCDNEWFAIDRPEDRDGLDNNKSKDNSVMFGWQFRPVLGADYVAGGPRQVFAQLALPEALGDSTFLPAVLVQTRWREYDEKRQVVGPVFHSSCTVTSVKDPVIIANPLRVNDTTWDDIGGGMLKIRAHGSFFSPAVNLQSGKTIYPPVTFDGRDLQFFAPAKDLLMNGDLNLVGENNQTASLTIPLTSRSAACNVDTSSLWAIPQSDGNARVSLILWPGKQFGDELPKTRPLVLIGSDVYGLKDKPFEAAKVCDAKGDRVCLYHFTADADSLRAAGNYYVRELSWSRSNLPGSIHFAPFMASLSKYYEDPPKKSKLTQTTYSVSGRELKYLRDEKSLDLKVYAVNAPGGATLSQKSLLVISDSQALLTLPFAPKGKTITLSWVPSRWPLSREAPIVWDLALPTDEAAPEVMRTPSLLFAGDSRTVTFSGVDFSHVKKVTFETKTLLGFKKSPDDPKSMDVFVPTSVTKEAGHKELIAVTEDKHGKIGRVVLPIDIEKR